MEQHPVPQNVTNFQFKLVGDITIKQFAYLAVGLLLAYIVTKISFVPVFISYPLAGALVLLGIGLAFVPVAERPLDRWLVAFFKSIYSPTYFLYKKQNQPPEILMTALPPTIVEAPLIKKPVSQNTSQEFMSSLPSSPIAKAPPVNTKPVVIPKPTPPLPPLVISKPQPVQADTWSIGAPPKKLENALYKNYPSQASITGKKIVFEEKPVAAPIAPKSNPKEVEKIKENYQKATQKLTDQLASLQKDLQEGNVAKERFMEVQQIFSQLIAEKEKMGKEITILQKQLEKQSTSGAEVPTMYKDVKKDTQVTVKMMSQGAARQSGIPRLTNQPNVVTGIIKDSQGQLLPNIIITIRDKESVPVRAFKTNRLGQFAASTPLPSGIYIIEMEDPKKSFRFHRIEVVLDNQVLPPLEVSAVSEKDLLRQKLSQELFGGNRI